MYYVPDGTKTCGYYECKKCGNRFLSLQTMEKIPCPDCEAEIDYEIGPGESLEDVLDTAVLLQKLRAKRKWKRWMRFSALRLPAGILTGFRVSAVALNFYRICLKFFRDFKRKQKLSDESAKNVQKQTKII